MFLQQSINVEQLIVSKQLIGTAAHRSTSTPSTSNAADTIVSNIPRVSNTNCRVKLPKLVLKTFNGDLTKWETFWNTFESSIHLRPNLVCSRQVYIPQLLLEGTVMRAVGRLKLTIEKEIWKKKQIISRHIDTLLELESLHQQKY